MDQDQAPSTNLCEQFQKMNKDAMETEAAFKKLFNEGLQQNSNDLAGALRHVMNNQNMMREIDKLMSRKV